MGRRVYGCSRAFLRNNIEIACNWEEGRVGGYEINIGIAGIDDRLRLMVDFGVKVQWVVGCKIESSMKWYHRLTYTIVC